MRYRRFLPYALTLSAVVLDLFLILSYAPSGPTGPSGISSAGLFWLRLISLLPFAVSWMAGTRAVVALFEARENAQGERVQMAYTAIGSGIAVLIVSSALSVIVNSFRTVIQSDALASFTFNVVFNLIGAFGPLIGFWMIFSGSGRLRLTKEKTDRFWRALGVIAYVVAAFMYAWFIFSSPTRLPATASTLAVAPRLSELENFLIIIVPSLAWTGLALASLFRFSRYYVREQGVMRFRTYAVNYGVALIALSFILQQLLFFTGVFQLTLINVATLLIINFTALACQLAGFLVFAHGIRRAVTSDLPT